MAVDELGLEVAQKAAAFCEAAQKARRILVYIETDDIERGRPLMRLAISEDDERDRMTARHHALSQRHCLPFRSADTQRGEHVRYPHSTRTMKKVKWDDDNSHGHVSAVFRFGLAIARVQFCSQRAVTGNTDLTRNLRI